MKKKKEIHWAGQASLMLQQPRGHASSACQETHASACLQRWRVFGPARKESTFCRDLQKFLGRRSLVFSLVPKATSRCLQRRNARDEALTTITGAFSETRCNTWATEKAGNSEKGRDCRAPMEKWRPATGARENDKTPAYLDEKQVLKNSTNKTRQSNMLSRACHRKHVTCEQLPAL